MITAEFLPRNEQALRAREQLRGEAELELPEVPDTRYPEESRVIKLLDGLRLDERATSALLLAAGNKYEMKAVLDAIKIQYPAGMSITGLPTLKAAHLKKLGGGSQRRVQYQRKSRAWHAGAWHADADESWDYEAEEHETQQYDETEHAAEDQHEAAYGDVEYDEEDVDGGDATTAEPEHGAQTAGSSSDALSAVVEALTVTSKRLAEITKSRGFYQDKGKGKNPSKSGGKSKGKSKGADKGRSKGKGKGKPGPTPSKGNFAKQRNMIDDSLCLGCSQPGHWLRDCPYVSTFSAQVTTAGSVLDADGYVVDHASWMVNCIPAVSEHGALEKKECDLPVFDIHPNFDMVHAEPIIFESIAVSKNEHVHVESVVHESNAVFAYDMVPQHDMIPQHDMVFDDEQFFQNVSLIQSIEVPKDFKVSPNDPIESNALVINLNPMPIYKNPQILLQSVLDVEGSTMIADTGCQRKVAGFRWHGIQQENIKSLKAVQFGDTCTFSFRPHEGMPATMRLAYPAGLGGAAVALGASQVECDAPALFRSSI